MRPRRTVWGEMFSGIVEELGEVAGNDIAGHGRLWIAARQVVRDLTVGDSVAVNGCCLTVVAADARGFTADVMPETARRTTLAGLSPGDPVNLEAALALGDRVGGHMVTGHVDAVGTVVETRDEGNARWTSFAAPSQVVRHLVEKGCVAVDGVSLTVVSVAADRFTVSLIPHTLAVTTAQGWQPGRRVNLEVDLIARYVERSLSALAAAHATPAAT
jgi:riboflavin synthase